MEKENLTLSCGNFLVYHPMRYQAQPKESQLEEMMNGEGWILQEKKDGSFFQLMINAEGEIGLFSRTVSKTTKEYVNRIDNVPHVKEWAEKNLPKDTILVGEIYVPKGHSNDTTKIMGALPDKAISRQFDSNEFGGPVHYYIFDCLRFSGEDLIEQPTSYRISLLEEKIENTDYIEIATSYVMKDEYGCGTLCNSFQEKLAEIFAAGGEGAVLKRIDAVYEPGKRPKTYCKFKEHVDSIDLVITELLDPEKEYTGKELDSWQYWEEDVPVTKHYYYKWKNAIKVAAYSNGKLVEIGRVASGFTDEDRADMAVNPDRWIGAVAECACMSINREDWTLRHPTFIKLRTDKNPQECILEEL